MSDLGDAIQGIWTLLEMLGSLVRMVIGGNRTTIKRELRSRDNAWLGGLTIIALCLFMLFLTGCDSSLPKPSMEDDLLVGDYLFVTKPTARAECPPGIYMVTHEVSSLTRAITDDKPFDLSNDTLALALLDSMLNSSTEETRRFYFWVVTKSFSRSDGYYSEGVGFWGTEHLIHHPKEFLETWSECITMKEQRKWAWYLAAEENIVNEGYPTDIVMRDYDHRLDSVTKDLPGPLLNAKSSLLKTVDSIYRELAKYDRPINTSEAGF